MTSNPGDMMASNDGKRDARSALGLIDTLFDEIQDSIDHRYVFDSITRSQKESLKFLWDEIVRMETLRGIEEKFQKDIWIDDGSGGHDMNVDAVFIFLKELQDKGFSIEGSLPINEASGIKIPANRIHAFVNDPGNGVAEQDDPGESTDLLSEAIAADRLVTTPYRGPYYTMSAKTREIVKRDIEPKLDPEFLEHVPEMVAILKKGLVDPPHASPLKKNCPRCGSSDELDASTGTCSYCDLHPDPNDHETCADHVVGTGECWHHCVNCGRFWSFNKGTKTWKYLGTIRARGSSAKECPKCDGAPRILFHADPSCEYCHGEYFLPPPPGVNVDPPEECPACRPACIEWQFKKVKNQPEEKANKTDKKPSIKVKNDPLFGIVTNAQRLRRYHCPKCGNAYPLKKESGTNDRYWKCNHCKQTFIINASFPDPITIKEYIDATKQLKLDYPASNGHGIMPAPRPEQAVIDPRDDDDYAMFTDEEREKFLKIRDGVLAENKPTKEGFDALREHDADGENNGE